MLILMMMMAANRKQQQQQQQRVPIKSSNNNNNNNSSATNSSSETVIARTCSPEVVEVPPANGYELVASSEQLNAEQLPANEEVPATVITNNKQRSNSSTSRLRSFLQLTAHLNPFYHPVNQQQQQQCANQRRKSSLDSTAGNSSSSRQRNPFTLIELAQRYFGHLSSSSSSSRHSGELHNHNHQHHNSNHSSPMSKSAPVTPVKWQQLPSNAAADSNLTAQQQHLFQQPNGFKRPSEMAADEANQVSQSSKTQRPSVRFSVDSADSKRRARLGRWGHSKQVVTAHSEPQQQQQQQQFTDQAVQTSSAESANEEDDHQKATPATAEEDLVARLFKLPEQSSEQQQPRSPTTGETPMDSERFRKYGYSLIDYISNYLDTISERRVTPLNIVPGYLKNLIASDAPELGESFARIMQDFEKHIMCGITHWQHPHFHAYFPAGNAYASILADMLSDALGCVGFSWAASPAYTELEIIMLDWMGKMIGLPDEFLCLSGVDGGKGGGVIQGSASECVLVNLLAARHWAMEKLRKKYPDTADGLLLGKLIGYCSKEAHSCVEKAAMIGFIRMRALDTDEKQSLRGDTLRSAMEADITSGLEPFIVCATLGTTSCVSFDNLEELGQVCKEHDVWLHVDAAYAGSALICPEFKHLIKGVELASSFNMNPNKWMLINFDCSLMWVRDRFKLTRAFVVDPLYLQHSFSDQAIDYRHWGIPLSRRFRALKLWFVIRNYGVEGLRAYIRNHVRLAKLFAELISQDPRFTITNEVTLGLVCFRLVGSNALNQRLLSMINASGQLHMVPASVNGRYVIRFCVCDQNAKEEDINFAYQCISDFASELFESIRAGKERIRAISQQNTIDVSSVSLHTQQSFASADRLNKTEQQQQQTQQVVTSQQQPAEQQVAAHLNRHHMLRRGSRHSATLLTTCELDEEPHKRQTASSPASHSLGGAKSPLIKQLSVATNSATTTANNSDEVAVGGGAGAAICNGDPTTTIEEDDLAEEVVLENSTDELDDYELLDEEDLVDDERLMLMSSSPPLTTSGDHQLAARAASNDCAMVASFSGALNRSPAARRWQASRAATARNQTLAGGETSGSATNHEAEAEDEVFTLERRNRMSLRYKREFFVRVVSDPRVYRASISGDINAHSSCASLGGAQQPTSRPTGVPTSTSGQQAQRFADGSAESRK